MREVDPPSLFLINFDIPVLTPGLHWAETALEFSNNKTLLAIWRIRTGVVCKEGYLNTVCSKVKAKVMLRPTVSQSVLVSSTHLGLTTRFLFLSDCCGFVDMGSSLWRENGSAVYNSCWSSSAQSFSGPSTLRFVTIFYCLRFWDFPFRRLLRLAGSRWRYSNPPPHGGIASTC
jgi:hypothetical protein